MKKTLLYCLLLLAIGCRSSESDDNPPILNNKTCLPISYSYNTGSTIENYHYDEKGRIEKIEFLHHSQLEWYYLMEYDNQDRVIKRKLHKPNGQEENFVTIEYNSSGKIIKNYNYMIVNGSPISHSYQTYEYNSNNEVIKSSHYRPSVSLDYHTYYTFEYQNGIMQKRLSYDSTGKLQNTITIEYDGKKGFRSGAPYSFLLVSEGIELGFPYQHNIKKLIILYPGGHVVESGQGKYEYNEEGYPTKFTPLYPATREIETFSYKCL